MDPNRIALFALADRRLAWADRRQQLLAQNIANADTPGWRARDLKSFADTLSGKTLAMAPVATEAGHLPATASARLDTTRTSNDRAPDGNSVQLDDQLSRVADTETTQALVTGLYTKYLGMFRTALGH